jgi:hypothetical protein
MTDEPRNSIRPALSEAASAAAEPKVLSPAAQRALAEAAERRRALAEQEAALAATREINGRGGKDPVRYSDWEVKGIAIDF